MHLTSDDLEQGNADKGLLAGIGAGAGDWRLRLRSTLEIEVLAYIRTDDGFLASVHDLVPRTPEGHRVAVSDAYRGQLSALTNEYRLLYGGIDSDGITERARDLTSIMAGVAKRHAAKVSCAVVMRELYLVPEAERKLFGGIDLAVTPGSEFGASAIRSKLVELYDKMFGVQVTTPHSPQIEPAYRLFVDELGRAREDQDTWFNPWDCNWARDQSFFEGILDGAVVEFEDETGWRGNDHDWDRLGEFFGSRDWSDRYHTARAWTVVLAYLLMDYRYLYL